MNVVTRARTAEHAARIICGTDFSENARQAARAAAVIAERLNDPVLLVHAVDTPSIKPATRAELFKSMAKSRRRWLLEEGKRMRDAGANVSEQIISGPPDEVLVKLSQ